MAHFISATLTISALAAFGVLSTAPKHQPARAPQFQAQTMLENAPQWIIHNQTNGAKCMWEKSDSGTLKVSTSCKKVSSAVSASTRWQSHENGISLIDQDGNIVLTFTPSQDRGELVSDSLSLTPST